MTPPSDPDDVGRYLVSSRSFREYEAMFSLNDEDLDGHVLDCPGGASSFTVEASELGSRVTAADPVYAMSTLALQELAMDEPDRGSAHTAAGVERYLWDFYGDIEGHRAMRKSSAALFARDIEVHPERYVSASLPTLPFEDRQFDLVLSSHFLFTYADRLDQDFHYQALMELQRICRREVRVFPLLDQGGHALGAMTDAVLALLVRQGIEAEIRDVPYEFQRGGDQMLVLSGDRGRTA
jgi:hypothetical protein